MIQPTPPRRAALYVRNDPFTGSLSDSQFEATMKAANAAMPQIVWDDDAYEEDGRTKFLAHLLIDSRKIPYERVFIVYRIEHLASPENLLPILTEIRDASAYFFSVNEPQFRWVSPEDLPTFDWSLALLRDYRVALHAANQAKAREAMARRIAAGEPVGRNARPPCRCGHRHPNHVKGSDGKWHKNVGGKPVDVCPDPTCTCTKYEPVEIQRLSREIRA